MADITLTADFSDIQTMNRELLNVAKSARTSATTFEREYNRVEKALNRNARASQALYGNILKLDEPFKDAAKSASVFERELAKVERTAVQAAKRQAAATAEQTAQEERLRRKFIEGHAAMELYSKELNDLAVARKAGIITAEQQRQGLERLNQQMASGTGVFSAYGKTMQEATTRNNRLGVVTQQAGYQIGDFLVQVQSGTNPMVAFGQQATQLAGVMTMFGGKMLVIGSILGIAIPLFTAIGAAFLRSRQEANKAAEDLNTLDDELKALDKTLQDWVRSKRAAEAGITIEELLGGEGLKDAEKNLRSAREELKRFRDEITGEGRFETTGIGLAINYAQTLMASKELDAAAAAYVSAVQRLEQLRQKQAEEQYKTFAEEAIQLKQQLEMQKTIAQFGEDSDEAKILALQQQVDSYNRAIKEQVRSGELTKAQGDELIRLNTSLVEGEALLKLMADHAYNLGDNLKFAADIAPKVQERAVRIGVASGAIPPEALKDLPQTAGEKAMEEILNRRRADARKEPKKGRGGGGKSEENRMEQFIQSLMTERETLESWRSEQLDLLQQYNDTELAIIGGQAEAKLRIEQEYSNRLVQLKQQESALVRNSAQGMYSELAGLLDMFAGKSKAAAIASIALTKGLRIAEVITSGAAAQVRALAELGPILGPPAAAKIAGFTKIQAGIIAATGLVQAASVGRGSSGGLSGGGSPSGADAAISGNVAAAPQRVIIEGIDRNSLISGEQLSNIFEALYKENENRGFVFEVAR